MDKTETLSGYSIGLAMSEIPISGNASYYLRQALEKTEGENRRKFIGVLGENGLGYIGRVLVQNNLWARLHPNKFYRRLTNTTDPYAPPVGTQKFLDAFGENGGRFVAFAAQTGGFGNSRDEVFRILRSLIFKRVLTGYCMGSIISPVRGYDGREVEPGLRVISPSIKDVETLVRY